MLDPRNKLKKAVSSLSSDNESAKPSEKFTVELKKSSFEVIKVKP